MTKTDTYEVLLSLACANQAEFREVLRELRPDVVQRVLAGARGIVKQANAIMKSTKTKRTYTGKHCSVCGEPQFTTPSGTCCANEHGGSSAKEDELNAEIVLDKKSFARLEELMENPPAPNASLRKIMRGRTPRYHSEDERSESEPNIEWGLDDRETEPEDG